MGSKIVEVVMAVIASIIIYNILTHGAAADTLVKDSLSFVNVETRSLEGM